MITPTALRRLADMMERGQAGCTEVRQNFSNMDGMEMQIVIRCMEPLDIAERPAINITRVEARDPDRWIAEMDETLVRAARRQPAPRIVPGQRPLGRPVMLIQEAVNFEPAIDLLVAIIKKIVLAWASAVVTRTAMIELK